MTKDELRNHCKKMCRRYSCIPDSSAYEEHKLILELLDQDEAITKASILKALEDVRAEIDKEIEDKKEVSNLTIATKTYMRALVMCRQMIDRKIAEITKDCTSCTHSDELDGEYCYECVKGDKDNFEAVRGNEE